VLLRPAGVRDHGFIVEMARLACSLEGRHPVPPADAPEVLGMLPSDDTVAVVASDADGGVLLGAAWCHVHAPPLLLGEHGQPLPELVTAVRPEARGRGTGTALVEAVADAVSGPICLNVHLLNPAVRLYVRTGFRVAGQGRGWYGVAMRRDRDAATHRV
jgi:GNAT superfamily N-acetyltransferase